MGKKNLKAPKQTVIFSLKLVYGPIQTVLCTDFFTNKNSKKKLTNKIILFGNKNSCEGNTCHSLKGDTCHNMEKNDLIFL